MAQGLTSLAGEAYGSWPDMIFASLRTQRTTLRTQLRRGRVGGSDRPALAQRGLGPVDLGPAPGGGRGFAWTLKNAHLWIEGLTAFSDRNSGPDVPGYGQ